ncbi:MAG: hypothetical protein EBR09_07060 [Proteobacteria bacterium]|nr:hypothetical protein [Pseudomonadota bacterium]
MLNSARNGRTVHLKWNDAAELITQMSEFRQRGFVCRDAVLETLRISKFNALRQFARILSLPFETDICDKLPVDTSFRQSKLSDAAARSLLRRRGLGSGFVFWQGTFLSVFRAHRRLNQQSGQARVQSVFLIFFVPAIALWMILSQYPRFSENISTDAGKSVGTASVILYLCGVISVRIILFRSIFRSAFCELKSVTGRFNFLTEMMCLPHQGRSKLSRIYDVCRDSGDKNIIACARRLNLGFEFGDGTAALQNLPAASEFLGRFSSAFLASAGNGQRWLAEEHNKMFEEFEDFQAQRAAAMSLRLLVPMALFFLPALFLILVICGFSFHSDALN